MERDLKVVILYRMAEEKQKDKVLQELSPEIVNTKTKLDGVDNVSCLNTLLNTVKNGTRVTVFGDNLEASTIKWLNELPIDFHETNKHGNAETFLEVFEYALENYEPQDIIYFVEDDYIHREGFVSIIIEGLTRADYISLYDHPDKYGQKVILFHTESTHWQFVPSTTMTFAAKVKTLVFDELIFKQWVTTGIPNDYHLFMTLTQKLNRKLATPIPSYSTHGEEQFLAPLINWD